MEFHWLLQCEFHVALQRRPQVPFDFDSYVHKRADSRISYWVSLYTKKMKLANVSYLKCISRL